MSSDYDKVPTDQIINQTASALQANGMTVETVDSIPVAKTAALKYLPKGSNVFTTTSETTRLTGVAEAINEGAEYNSVRKTVTEFSEQGDQIAAKKAAAVPEYVVGSAHAITQDGKLLIASASASQIPSISYGADKVLLMVGAQKIVKDIEDGMHRIESYALPLEDARAQKAYGIHSAINQLLVINKAKNERIHIILIKENIGF